MFAIARRELAGLFLSPLAWVLLALNQGVLAWVMLRVVERFTGLEAAHRVVGLTRELGVNLFGLAAALALLGVPLLGMRLFSEEFRSGSWVLLAAAPLSLPQILFGKLLGLAGLVLTLAALPLLLSLSLLPWVPLDLGLLGGATLGLLLAQFSFAAVGLFCSSLTTQPALAAAAAYGGLLALSVANQAAPATGGGWIWDWLTWSDHLLPFLAGRMQTSDIAYFLLLGGLNLALTLRQLERRRRGPGSETGAWRQEVPFHVLLLLATGLLAWLSLRHVWAWDLTVAGGNSLAPESRALVERLEAPLTLTCHAPEQGPLRRRIAPLLERYQRANPDRIKLQWLDPELHPDQARAAGVQVTGELVLDYQGRRERLRVLNEDQVSNALLRLLARPDRWIGSLAGHGERALDGRANHDLGQFGQELRGQGYRVQPLDLGTLGTWPDNLGRLIIAGPQTNLGAGEVHRLRTYVRDGGRLLWLLDTDGLWGLDELAEDLGIRPLPGVVVDANGAELGIDDPTVALVTQYANHPATQELRLMSLFPKAAALDFQAVEGWSAVPLLTTQDRSWNETGTLQGAVRRDPAQGERAGPLTLGLALSRTPDSQGPEQRVLVLGDGDFLSNSFLANAGNRELGLRLVRWVMGEDQLLSIPPRDNLDRELMVTPALALLVGVGGLILLPLGFLATGLWIRWYRQRG